jgi:hypothetical protein
LDVGPPSAFGEDPTAGSAVGHWSAAVRRDWLSNWIAPVDKVTHSASARGKEAIVTGSHRQSHGSSPSTAPGVSAAERRLETFEDAQRLDMESFRDFDREAFRNCHHPDAVSVFAGGARRIGIDAIMAALELHFVSREAIRNWTEVYRVVRGCNSAFILYDITHDIRSTGHRQRTLTGVTYTHTGGRWLAIADQGTSIEAPGS